MSKLHAARATSAAALAAVANAALAAGDAPSTEVAATGGTLMMLVGGLVVLGIVIWLVLKLLK
jgi:hypothetical protein